MNAPGCWWGGGGGALVTCSTSTGEKRKVSTLLFHGCNGLVINVCHIKKCGKVTGS